MPADTRYDADFFLWTQRQAEELRRAAYAGSNLPLDWENLAEEIESLGRRDRRELGSMIEVILAHLIKLAASPAEDPRLGWEEEVDRFRMDAERILEDSPSLKSQLDDIVKDFWCGGVLRATKSLRKHGEYEAARPILALWQTPCLSPEQILAPDVYPERATNRMVKAMM